MVVVADESSQSKPNRKIRFGSTSVSPYLTDGEFTKSSSRRKRKRKDIDGNVNEANVIKPVKTPELAVQYAKKWELWLGTKDKTKRSLNKASKKAKDDRIPKDIPVFDSDDSDSDAAPAENARRKWIVDTGSGHDLIGEKDIVGDYNTNDVDPIRFNTLLVVKLPLAKA